jgi:hypothetical protein
MSTEFVRFSAVAGESAGPAQGPRSPAAPSASPDSPDKVLVEMMTTGRIQEAIYAAAVLGVVDVLTDGPMEVEKIARRIGAQAGALRRLLRALAGYGIFAEEERGRFVLTPMPSVLGMGTPLSLRSVAIWCGTVAHRIFGDIEPTIRTGTPAFDHTFGSWLGNEDSNSPRNERADSTDYSRFHDYPPPSEGNKAGYSGRKKAGKRARPRPHLPSEGDGGDV